MPRKGPKLSERAKLKRDLLQWIELLKLPRGSKEHSAAVKRWVMRKNQLTESDLRRRRNRWIELGSPALHSPEWQAELKRLRPLGKRPRMPPANTDSLYSHLMHLATLQAAHNAGLPGARPVDLFELPGQSRRHDSKEEQAEARRMYRWLWRHFPGQLKACDSELRKLIRQAGGIA